MPPHCAELITTAQMGAIDAASAASGVPVSDLMRAAGQAVADAIAARFSPRPLLTVCGPGNNGGDGWVAATILKRHGWPIRVCTLAPVSALKGAAAEAARAWNGPVEERFDPAGAELFIDAIFGAGLSRPLEGQAREIAAHFAQARDRVIAVDVPSGLSGDTGKPAGDVCAAAGITVTFVRKKPGHLLMPGRALCGEIVLADIGAPDSAVEAEAIRLWENQPALWLQDFPWPSLAAHKHARGHVMIASGGFGRSGAARLAARAALRIGAGLVTVLAPRAAMPECAAQLAAIMLRQADDAAGLGEALETARAAVIGPGFGLTPEHAETLHTLLPHRACACVLDADALTFLAGAPALWREAIRPDDVLTPHPGEFERLFPGLLAQSASRLDATLDAARRAGCAVLLKGPDTVIAAPDGRAIINAVGTAFLATAGSGDVLAGAIAGLMGQGMAPFEAAAAAVWLHGRAAERFGPGLIAEDLPEIFPRLLNGLEKIETPIGAEAV